VSFRLGVTIFLFGLSFAFTTVLKRSRQLCLCLADIRFHCIAYLSCAFARIRRVSFAFALCNDELVFFFFFIFGEVEWKGSRKGIDSRSQL
jgi:hypothetical protein